MFDRGTTLEALREGEIEIVGRIVASSNNAMLVTMTRTCPDPEPVLVLDAIYKPTLGERPLDDFPDGTLAHREVAAWHVSEASGWGIVPPTILRDGPFGEGMVQAFVEADPAVDVVAMVVDDDPRLRRMHEDDLTLMARWRNEPHVRAWWEMDGDPMPYTPEDAREEYGPDLEPEAPTIPAIILMRERPVGYVQWYRWAGYADEVTAVGIPDDGAAFGLDIFIGEPDVVGTGVGSAAVDLVCRTLFAEGAASSVALLTAVGNEQAQRAYEKAGLRKVRRALDTDIKNGQRVESWLMIRERD